LCGRLELPWSNSALHFYRKSDAINASKLSDLWHNLDTPVDSRRVGGHLDQKQSDFVAAVEGVVADLMHGYGYAPIYCDRVRSLTPYERAEIRESDARLRAQATRQVDADRELVHTRRYEFLRELGRHRGLG
jgi:hypothetical protein